MSEPTELVKAMRGSPEFVAVMESMVAQRPLVPAFKVVQTQDEEYRQSKVLTAQTARQEGFDLLFQLLTGKRLDQRNIKGDTHG